MPQILSFTPYRLYSDLDLYIFLMENVASNCCPSVPIHSQLTFMWFEELGIFHGKYEALL